MSGFPPATDAIAFAGRSNAGKSSALNALCGGRYARVARTPGRTRAVNLFQLRNGGILADLPGYGYAVVAKAEQKQWGHKLLRFMESPQLRGLVLIVDCRRGLQEKDYQLLQLTKHLPSLVLLSKADKLNRTNLSEAMKTARQNLETAKLTADILAFSALKKTGIVAARATAADLLSGKPAVGADNDHNRQQQ